MSFFNLAYIDYLGEDPLDQVDDGSSVREVQNLYPVRYRGRETLEELRADDQESVEAVCSIVTGSGFKRYWGRWFCWFHCFCFCLERNRLFNEDQFILVRGSDMFVSPGPNIPNDDTKPRYMIDLTGNTIRRTPFTDEDDRRVIFFIEDQEGESLYIIQVQGRLMAQGFTDAFERGGVPVFVRGDDEETEVTLEEAEGVNT